VGGPWVEEEEGGGTRVGEKFYNNIKEMFLDNIVTELNEINYNNIQTRTQIYIKAF